MNNELIQCKNQCRFEMISFRFSFVYFVNRSDLDEEFIDENIPVTLDDVLSIKMDFSPSIANSMWFA